MNKKKLFAVLLSCVCLFSLCSAVSADGGAYVLDDWGITVTVPEGYTVIDENTPEDHPYFDVFGYTKETYMEYMAEEGIVFDATDDDVLFEYCVYVADSYLYSYNMYDSSYLEDFAGSALAEYSSAGATVYGNGVYVHPQVSFCYIEYTSPYGAHCVEYWTTHEYKAVSVLYISYDGYTDPDFAEAAEKFVSGISFESGASAPDLSDSLTGGTYAFEDAGITVTVPDDLHVIYEGTPENDPIFGIIGWPKDELLGYFDMSNIILSAMPADGSTEILIRVEDADSLDFTETSSFLLEIMKGIRASTFQEMGVEVLGSELYGQSQTPFIVVKYYDASVPSYDVSYYTVVDGKGIDIRYVSYYGELSAEDDAAIVSFIDGISFDNVSTPSDDGSLPIMVTVAIVIIALVCIAVIVVIVIAVVTVRKNKAGKKAEVADTAVSYIYCRKCGTKLNADSTFCHSCGTEVRK